MNDMSNPISTSANNIIEGIQCIQQETCLLGSLRSLFGFWNSDLRLRESAVLGLGFGYSFRYGYYLNVINEACVVKYTPDIACFHMFLDHHRLNAFAERIGVKIIERRGRSLDDIVGIIKSEIAESRPVMLPVNNEYLPYLADELRYVMGRFVVCYGWNDAEGSAYVSDQFIPSIPPSHYKGPLPIDSFMRAMDLMPVAQDNDFAIWCCAPISSTRNLNYREFLNYGLDAWSNQGIEEYCFQSSKVVYHSGIEALSAFRQDLARIADNGIGMEEQKWLAEVYELLVSFGGPVKARKLYSDFIDWMDTRVTVPVDLRKQFHELHAVWTTTANVIFKAANKRDVNALLRAVKLIDHLAGMEEEAVQGARHI